MVALKNPVSVPLHLTCLQATDEFGRTAAWSCSKHLRKNSSGCCPRRSKSLRNARTFSNSRYASGRATAVAYEIRRAGFDFAESQLHSLIQP